MDTGFMEIKSLDIPLPYLSAFPISTADIPLEGTEELFAASLRGVVVQLENLTIDDVRAPTRDEMGSFVFHDKSDVKALGQLSDEVKVHLEQGQKVQKISRGVINQIGMGRYAVLVGGDQSIKF